MSNYQERVEKFVQMILSLPKSPEFEVGTRVWLPCAGIRSQGIPKGHVGEIAVAETSQNGKVVWQPTSQWVDQQTVKSLFEGVIISASHGTCPSCVEIIDADD